MENLSGSTSALSVERSISLKKGKKWMKEILRILKDYKVVVVRETSRGELNCRCPYPDHDDKKSSFSINGKSGLYNCFGCGRKGNLVKLIADLEGVGWKRAKAILEQRYGIDVAIAFTNFDFPDWENRYALSEQAKDMALVYSIYAEAPAPQYYLDRGFTEEDWFVWEGRVDPEHPVMVFPVYGRDKQMVGIVARHMRSGSLRYENLEGSDPKSTLYGIHLAQNSEEVVVVEGLLDTQRVKKILGNRIDVVGLLSTTFSARQISLLSQWERISIWLDNDEEGKEATRKLSEELVERGKRVYLVPYFSDAKDQATIGFTDECLRASFAGRRNFLVEGLDII